MKRDPYEFQAKTCLEESGYNVDLIAEEQDDKRADLLASCETDSLIVEVKCKYDDLELSNQLTNAEYREILPYHAEIRRNNSLSSCIEEAARQIEASKILSTNAFGVLWFHPDPKLGLSDSDQRMRMTLYGGQYAFVDDPNGSQLTMPCYYTTYSDFYRCTSIDAVALHVEEGVQLLPNPFSDRIDYFKKTRIYKDFSNHSSIWTPELLVTEGDALCLHGEIDLKDIEAVRAALEKQNPGYKIVRFVDMHSYGGVMNIERA
jgi:hypothetical protein